ncbi:MAG: hypothetical protein ACRDU8_03460 [Egibacteraceae bacterium]
MSWQAAPPGSTHTSSPDALEAFWDLERWLASASSQRLGLAGVERQCERQGRELLRRMVQAHVDARGTGDIGAALRVATPDGVLRYGRKRLHTRRLVTLFGEVWVTRTGYGQPGRACVHPLDAQLGLPARCYSYELQRRLVKAAVLGPFDEAVAMLADTTGVAIPKPTAEQIVADAGRDFDVFYAQRAHHGDGRGSSTCSACAGPSVRPAGGHRLAVRGCSTSANARVDRSARRRL